jgi:ubiquinone/menaquinone biosynthesis C-methylase UbiE
MSNVDQKVVQDFGAEWKKFDQTGLSAAETSTLFDLYFVHFPWEELPPGSKGFDLGCGSGRWAKLVSDRVGRLHCIDPSIEALNVARRNLQGRPNCEFHLADVSAIPLEDGTMDFGYSLGVLHHVPDTAGGIRACTAKLKRGAPFLLYLYYAFDTRPWWFKAVWKVSDVIRRLICVLPFAIKSLVCQLMAVFVYFPLARASLLLEKCGLNPANFPLSAYRAKSFYVMRTDALDRFGTRLEQRFTRREVEAMMLGADLHGIKFNEAEPYWCAVGWKN